MSLVMKKEAHWIKCTGSRYVRLQLISSIYTGGLGTELGIVSAEPATGSTTIGKGRQLALINGCFPIRVEFKRGATASNTNAENLQSGTVLCSPEKADTVFNTIKGKKYRTWDIIDARPVRRRVFVV